MFAKWARAGTAFFFLIMVCINNASLAINYLNKDGKRSIFLHQAVEFNRQKSRSIIEKEAAIALCKMQGKWQERKKENKPSLVGSGIAISGLVLGGFLVLTGLIGGDVALIPDRAWSLYAGGGSIFFAVLAGKVLNNSERACVCNDQKAFENYYQQLELLQLQTNSHFNGPMSYELLEKFETVKDSWEKQFNECKKAN